MAAALARNALRYQPGWRSVLTLSLVLSAAATGCAAVYEGKYRFKDGWRRATVVRVISGAQLDRPDSWECTYKIPRADLAARTYAVVWYVSAKSKSYFAVEVNGAGAPMSAGTRVYVNVFECGQPPIARLDPAQRPSW